MLHNQNSANLRLTKMQISHMRQAVALSKEKMEAGFNQVTSTNDPTAHAEISAIRLACKKLNTFDLSGCEIYTRCEPCPMCLSAIYWARLDTIYYANGREDDANIGFDDAFLYDEINKPIPDRAIPTYQFLREEAIIPFKEWQLKQDKIMY